LERGRSIHCHSWLRYRKLDADLSMPALFVFVVQRTNSRKAVDSWRRIANTPCYRARHRPRTHAEIGIGVRNVDTCMVSSSLSKMRLTSRSIPSHYGPKLHTWFPNVSGKRWLRCVPAAPSDTRIIAVANVTVIQPPRCHAHPQPLRTGRGRCKPLTEVLACRIDPAPMKPSLE